MGESLWFEEGWFLSQTKEKVKKCVEVQSFAFHATSSLCSGLMSDFLGGSGEGLFISGGVIGVAALTAAECMSKLCGEVLGEAGLLLPPLFLNPKTFMTPFTADHRFFF